MPAPVLDGVGAFGLGLSDPLKWLCNHISLSIGADEEALKRLFSSDSRFPFVQRD